MANTDNMVSFIAAEAITEFAAVSVDNAGKVVITDASTDEASVGIAQRAAEAMLGAASTLPSAGGLP